MGDEATTIYRLRDARSADADTILGRLRAGSLESRAQRIAEALRSSTWEQGPAKLEASFSHHVIASKDGYLMRVQVTEHDERIELGHVEVFDIPTNVSDLGGEVMETARAAVDAIMDESFDSAGPMIASIANALDVKGDLQRKVTMEVAKQGVGRDAWWHAVVDEVLQGESINVPAPGDDLAESVQILLRWLREAASRASRALKSLDEREEDLPSGYILAARDIVEDLKHAVQALSLVNMESEDELADVYGSVGGVAGHLFAGATFLGGLTAQN